MIPLFAVRINGTPVKQEFIDRVYSITTTDSAEQEGDTCEIALDDRGPTLPMPPDMATIEIAFGYKGQQLVSQGTYILDEVELGNGPRSMVLRGVATPVGKPGGAASIGAATGPVKSLLNYIYAREGGYNSYNQGSAGDGGSWPGGLPNLTIGQVMDLQAQGKVFAVGAGQFTPSTLPIAVRDAGLSRNDKFSPANQDKLTTALMLGSKRPALRRYLRGESNDINAAQFDLCQEWAGAVCPTGRGFYDGDSAGNRGSGTVAQAQAAMKSARAELAAAGSAAKAESAAQEESPGGPTSTAPRSLIKEKRTESYHDTTIAEIAGKIAERHKLKLNVEGKAGEVPVKHEDQTNESDQNFLTRLANKYGLVIKPAEGALHVLPRGERALAGNIDLEQRRVTNWRARLKDRARFGRVRARWIDREENKEKIAEVEADSEDGEEEFPTHELPELHRDEKEAKEAAAAALQGLTSGYVEVNITMPGMPQLLAQGTITLKDFHPEIDGEPWLVKNVTQRITGSGGYTTTVICGTPGDEPKRWDDSGSSGQPRGGKADQDVVAFANGRRPVNSWTKTSGFGERGGRHAGDDYAMPVGTNLSSRLSGKVLYIGNDPAGYGKFMDVQLADGRVARLAHLSRTWIAPGKPFSPNQVLGQSGNTGRSGGPHLHLEDRTGGTVRDPSGIVGEFSADP